MKENALLFMDNFALSEAERTEIDLHIDDVIEKYREDSGMLSFMALESASLATAVEARSSGIMQQGFFSRLWNGFTGKNQELMVSNQQDITRAQYLSQQMLNKLFEQNLVQFELMVVIEHKFNILAHDILDNNQKLLKVCNIMSGFLEELGEIKTEMAEVQCSIGLLSWKEGIHDDKMFQGKVYNELQNEQKIVCIANDFFTISKGKWNNKDLPLLKGVMRKVGLDPDETVIPVHILKFIMEDEFLLQRFFEETGYDVATLSSETPFFIRWLTDRNMENSMSCFDMVMGLIKDLVVSSFLVAFEEIKEEAERKAEEECKRKEEEERKRKAEEERKINGPYGKKISGPLPDMEFVWIPAGSFMMSSPTDDLGQPYDEKQYKVTLTKGFYMQTTPVTQAQWKEIMENNPSHFKGNSRPVENVSWNDVQAFIKKLNQREGSSEYRLPTEAQWKYAHHAGTTTALNSGVRLTDDECRKLLGYYDRKHRRKMSPLEHPTSNLLKLLIGGKIEAFNPLASIGNRWRTYPVGQLPPNDWGLFDMHGNVWEWCQVWYGDYPEGHVTDPAGASSGAFRFLCGGGMGSSAWICPIGGFDYDYSPDYGADSIGFRLVRFPE